MNGHNLIIVGLVLVAIVAHVAVWWSGKWTWDGIVMGVVLCLAGMAVERNSLPPTTATPLLQNWIIDVVNRAEIIHREQTHAVAANRTAH